MLEFLLALTRQGHVIYHTTPSHPPNPFLHSSIQQIHNINMKDDGSTHYDILHSIHLIYPICHILHFFLNAISLSLSLARFRRPQQPQPARIACIPPGLKCTTQADLQSSNRKRTEFSSHLLSQQWNGSQGAVLSR